MNMSPARHAKPVSASRSKETALQASLTPQVWRRSQNLVRASGYRATEPGLRALDLQMSVLRARLRRTEAERVSLPILELSNRIQPKPGLPGRWAHGPSVSRADRPQPRAARPENHQDHPGLQAPPEISPSLQALGRMGGRDRETCV